MPKLVSTCKAALTQELAAAHTKLAATQALSSEEGGPFLAVFERCKVAAVAEVGQATCTLRKK
jgi:hypothetical protein